MLKIIIIIIKYTLNNFTTHATMIIDHGKFHVFNFFKRINFIFKIIIHFLNVETNPRLQYA
jgi:hypothetical protein